MTPRFIRKHITGRISDDPTDVSIWTWMLCVFLYSLIAFRFYLGIAQANQVGKCRIRSISGAITSPFYTIGCNLGKNRFNLSVIIGE